MKEFFKFNNGELIHLSEISAAKKFSEQNSDGGRSVFDFGISILLNNGKEFVVRYSRAQYQPGEIFDKDLTKELRNKDYERLQTSLISQSI